MASTYGGFEIAATEGQIFTNSVVNDMLVYADSVDQKIHLGTGVNNQSTLVIDKDSVSVAGNINFTGLLLQNGEVFTSGGGGGGGSVDGIGSTNGNVFVKSGSNFGIGTSTPSAKLHVVGNTRLDGNLELVNRGFDVKRIRVTKPMEANAGTITTHVTEIPGLSTRSDSTFNMTLSNAQTGFKFANPGGAVASISSSGDMSLKGGLSLVNGIVFGSQTAPLSFTGVPDDVDEIQGLSTRSGSNYEFTLSNTQDAFSFKSSTQEIVNIQSSGSVAMTGGLAVGGGIVIGGPANAQMLPNSFPVLASTGSRNSPAYSFLNATDMGMFKESGSVLGFSAPQTKIYSRIGTNAICGIEDVHVNVVNDIVTPVYLTQFTNAGYQIDTGIYLLTMFVVESPEINATAILSINSQTGTSVVTSVNQLVSNSVNINVSGTSNGAFDVDHNLIEGVTLKMNLLGMNVAFMGM